jgi:hypothetical protein
MSKLCRKCGEVKPVEDFHRSGRDGYQAWCKPCRRADAARHYQQNLMRRRAQNRRGQAEFLRWYVGLKAGKPCADCGQSFHPAAMQWDHLPGLTKKHTLAELRTRRSRERVLDEIENCELVCANCHAVRTFRRVHGSAA